MLLQQLLQRNNQNVREVYLDQKSKKKIFNAHYFTRRKPFEFESAQSGLKLSVGNLLQNQVSESDMISRNKSKSSTIHQQSSFNIFRDKKIISNPQTQKIQPGRFNINLNHRSRSRQSEKKSKLYSAQEKLYKKKFSVEKPINKNIQSSSVGQTKITTAGSSHQSPRFKIFNKGVFELPESFTLKTSKIPFTPKSSVTLFNRPHSTLINYDQNNLSGRQESIHSRGRMRQQEQMTKSRKARSQQNFYIGEKSITEPISKIGFLQEFQQIQFKKEQGLRLEIEKMNLHRKTTKRNDYVNLFYEYQKSKAKLQKQDMYTPWKKYQKDNKKSLDLAQLIQLHQY